MKLSELITQVGDENVLVEPLNSFLIKCNGKTDHSVLTLRTNVMNAADWLGGTSQHVGLMIWLPKDKLPKEPLQNDQAQRPAHTTEDSKHAEDQS